MEKAAEKNKRIAKNTLFLYARMLISLAISLFTSRIVLEALGVTNYGVYNVAGGVIGLFTFLNASMSGATSRFLTYELGKENTDKLKTIFNNAMMIHIIIAAVIVVLAETVGIWFLNNKLVIPKESMTAAHWVFQLSILSAIIGMTQVPYSAAIMANEKMSIYAYFEIIGTVLRLLIVYLLWVLPGQKLIIYALLVTGVGITMTLINRLYCIKKFSYCRFNGKCEWKTMKPMLTFSGWDLYGNLSVMARGQGISMLSNMFFGTIVNAAIGIANQVTGACNGFVTNVTMAIKPQIIKSYASGEYDYMRQLLYRGAKFSFLIILFLTLPILVETSYILKLWLNVVPEYTVWICRLTLLFLYFSNMSVVLVTGVHATGDIRPPSLLNGTLYLSVLPITYFAYKLGCTVYTPFILNVVFVFCGAMANFYYTKRYVKILSFKHFITTVLLKCFAVAAISFILPIAVQNLMPAGIFRLIIVIISAWISIIGCSLTFAMDKSERQIVYNGVHKIISKFK